MMEAPQQTQRLVMHATRLDRDGRLARPPSEEYHGSPLPHGMDCLLPDLRLARRVDGDIDPVTICEFFESLDHVGDRESIHALRPTKRAHTIKTPSRLPDQNHAG